MGSYINLADQPKENWLWDNGKLIGTAPSSVDVEEGKLPVCLIDNVHFIVAGIAYNEKELRAFSHPDNRRKTWFLVDKEKLLDPNVSDLAYYLK